VILIQIILQAVILDFDLNHFSVVICDLDLNPFCGDLT